MYYTNPTGKSIEVSPLEKTHFMQSVEESRKKKSKTRTKKIYKTKKSNYDGKDVEKITTNITA